MKAQKASVLVQEPACAVLRNLAVNAGNKVKLAEAGGIEAVVAAMKEHKTSVLVQEHACAALWSLAEQGSLRQRIKAACDSRHQELGQRSPRQAKVGQTVQRRAKWHVKSASMRLCFGRFFLPVFIDLHALASISKLHVTHSVTSTLLQCFFIAHTHYYFYLFLSIYLSLARAHTQTHTHTHTLSLSLTHTVSIELVE